MRLTVDHRGYTLHYSENEDAWNCYDLGICNVSLAKTKAAVDKLLLKARKDAKFPCLQLGYDGTVTAVDIIEYIEAKVSKDYKSKHDVTKHYVASLGHRTGRGVASRSVSALDAFIHDTPDNRAALDQANELRAQAKILERNAAAVQGTIPRVTMDDIAALVRLKIEGIKEGAEE